MIRARYLLRFDDLCPTMRWSVWERVEGLLLEAGVRPILAVIPDNRDESLAIDPPHPAFWERVREWQARGWTIGLHGYQHRYVTEERGLFGWNDRSEFAGLPFEEQDEKIARGLAIFEREGVRAEVWVAPNHAFDATTVEVLRRRGVSVVSDGLGLRPYTDRGGTTWVPMQLWGFRDRPLGVWTVCLHHNTWGGRELEAFRADLAAFADRVTDLPSALARHGRRGRGPLDRAFAAQRRAKRRLRGLGAGVGAAVRGRA